LTYGKLWGKIGAPKKRSHYLISDPDQGIDLGTVILITEKLFIKLAKEWIEAWIFRALTRIPAYYSPKIVFSFIFNI